jgi:hypothetical protein
MKVKYILGNNEMELDLHGDTFVGRDEIMLTTDENLIQYTSWNLQGYSIEPFLNKKQFTAIKKGIQTIVKSLVIEVGGKMDDTFTIEKYHQYVDNNLHLKIAKLIQSGWHIDSFPIGFEPVNSRISEILNLAVDTKSNHIGLNNFFIRIVRPQNYQDNNPPHRDVWLDRLRNAVNIYVPLCGSNSNSSLGIIEGSHLLSEASIERTAEGAILNGTRYSVPCVIKIDNEVPKLIRPNPKENEVLLFSPYIVHGGGYNFNTDETRMSLEVRFWKTK